MADKRCEVSEWREIETAAVVAVPITFGLVTIVDETDFPLIANRRWQAHRRRDGKAWYAVSDGLRMHRYLMGVEDPKAIVDHKDGDGLNNRRSNLRVGTQSQNCVNRLTTPGPYLRGVQPHKNRWKATIKYKGKTRHIGYYGSEIEAHAAYMRAAIELHGDWMPLPDPPKPEGKS